MFGSQGADHHLRASGFTLIELAVILGMTALLASLILPALAKAQSKGRQVTCLQSLRQQALAVTFYAKDHQGFLPPSAVEAGPGNEMDWPFLLKDYVVQGARVYLCPADRRSAVSSYGLNDLVFADLTDPAPGPSLRLEAISSPAHTICLSELGTENDLRTPRPDTLKLVAPGSYLTDDKDARPSARHAQRCNLAFFDGHVDGLYLNQFYTNQTPANRWFLP